MSFGDKLRAIRAKNKLSLEKLGNEIGVTKATIWQWENVISNPDNIKTKNMDALCKFFNIPKERFFNDNLIEDSPAEYTTKKKPVFDDMLTKSIVYVLDNNKDMSNEDIAVAIRLLYNKVKDRDVIMNSDFDEVLKLLY
ncbi:MAG: helix-turn-helix transcriptional regulator [Alcanivoracaceae bacterium]|nr:helix-turn-helix transcriptional regulator [Alcanivoracaceae bacterium]